MIKIGPYTASSNNASKRQSASLCIKNADGVIMCKMRFEEPLSDPLRIIQTDPTSKYRKEFVERLVAAGVPASDVAMILRPTPTKYFLSKLKKSENNSK